MSLIGKNKVGQENKEAKQVWFTILASARDDF